MTLRALAAMVFDRHVFTLAEKDAFFAIVTLNGVGAAKSNSLVGRSDGSA
jgi:hypothetical protein